MDHTLDTPEAHGAPLRRRFGRSLAGTLALGVAVAVAVGPPSGGDGTTPSTPARSATDGPATDRVLVAGPDGVPVRDAAGDVLVVDLSEAIEVLADVESPADPDGDGLDADGNAVEWVAHEHVDELVDAGAAVALDPADPALAAICGDTGADPCALDG